MNALSRIVNLAMAVLLLFPAYSLTAGASVDVASGPEAQGKAELVAGTFMTADLNPALLPCILLVDDDNNAPDVRPYFTAALDGLGYDYDLFDVGGGGANGPTAAEMAGYKIVIWFSGGKWGGSAGPNAADEAELAAYLDAGGRLFLSSQDYLLDFGRTPFGQNYLGIGSYENDTGDAITKYGLAGDPIGGGLGPYALSYPSGLDDYGDAVDAGAGASASFRSGPVIGNHLDVDKDGGAWRTVFFGTSWVPIYNASAANGREVLERIIDWFGGCGCQEPSISELSYDINELEVTLKATVGGSEPISYAWDFGDGTGSDEEGPLHVYAEGGCHTVTLTTSNACGLDSWIEVICLCEPVDGVGFTWEPGVGIVGEVVTFSATPPITGTEPFTYTWHWGDGTEMALGMTGTHVYTAESVYTVTLTVQNACGEASVGHPVAVIAEAAPVAILSVTHVIDGLEVVWNTTVEGSEPISYAWDWGDGESSDQEDPVHIYAEGGCYTVTLVVGNPYGPDDSWAETVCLCEAVAGVGFEWDPEIGTVGWPVAFKALEPITGTAPFTYTWAWGDETENGTGITTTHVYVAEDTYTITLTVQNGCGEGQMAAKTIYVGGGSREWSLYLPLLVGR